MSSASELPPPSPVEGAGLLPGADGMELDELPLPSPVGGRRGSVGGSQMMNSDLPPLSASKSLQSAGGVSGGPLRSVQQNAPSAGIAGADPKSVPRNPRRRARSMTPGASQDENAQPRSGMQDGSQQAGRSPAPGRSPGPSPGPNGGPEGGRIRRSSSLFWRTPGRRERADLGFNIQDRRKSMGPGATGGQTASATPMPSGMTGGDPSQGGGNANEAAILWGTNITASAVESRFTRFVNNFKEAQEEGVEVDAGGQSKYQQLIRQAVVNQEEVVSIDLSDVHSMDPTLYGWVKDYPSEVIPIMDAVLTSVAAHMGLAQEGVETLMAKPFNLLPAHTKTIRDLDPGDMNKLVAIHGMVTRCSGIIPDLRVGVFQCQKCQHATEVAHVNGVVEEPKKCNGCGALYSQMLMHNLCGFVDKQLIKMQESPNNIPEGETPHSVTLYARDLDVDMARPGDRVTMTGIYRGMPVRINPRQRVLSNMFRTHLDVLHIHRDEKARLFTLADVLAPSTTQDAAEGTQEGTQPPDSFPESLPPMLDPGTITREQLRAKEAMLKKLAEDPNIYERLAASVAPNIWEMEDVKKGVLCQMFGGESKTFPGGRVRGEMHCLLLGDPGVSKSQLLGYVHHVAPRGIYTSGKGSSAVGLTAYVTKDPETGEMVLESGALVLSDRGICCIDEFDKMSDSARSMLHEVMEQQTVSVAKAGLISTLNARTSVLACANPIDSKYNHKRSLVENINLPPSLLSRFDLIYVILDKVDRSRDRRLARHLVSLFHQNPPDQQQQQQQGLINQETFREYVAYARAKVHPVITDEAAEQLIVHYRRLRQMGRDRDMVAVTPRQLESLIRLSESLARIHLQPKVEAWHVNEAYRLWHSAMSTCASTTSGGVMDLDAIITGMSAEDRAVSRRLPEHLQEIFSTPGQRQWTLDALTQEMQNRFNVRCRGPQLVQALAQLEHLVSYNPSNLTVYAR